MGKQKSTQTVQETRNPWAPAAAPLEATIGKVSALAKPSMFAPSVSASTMSGIKALENFAKAPNSVGTATATANDFMTRGAPVGLDALIAAARGDNLQGNPFIEQMIADQQEDLSSQINGMFSGSGRLGSGANQALLADRLGRLGTEARMSNYNTERGYQMSAAEQLASGGMTYAGMSPALTTAGTLPAQALLQAGGMRDAITNAKKKAPLSAAEYERQALMQLGSLGGTSNGTTTTTQKPSLGGQILGGVMMGGSMLSGLPPGMGFGGGSTYLPWLNGGAGGYGTSWGA